MQVGFKRVREGAKLLFLHRLHRKSRVKGKSRVGWLFFIFSPTFLSSLKKFVFFSSLGHCPKLDSAGKMKDCSFNTLLLSRGWPHCWVSEVFFQALKALLSFSFVWGVGVGPFATVYLGMSKESFLTSPRGWILETEFGSSALVTGTFPHTPLSQVISIMPVGTVTFYVVCANSFSSDSAGDSSSHQTTGKEAMLFKNHVLK